MARFNKAKASTKTTNLAGGSAYKQTDKLEFVSILLTSFLKDQYYRSGDETMNRLTELYRGLPDKKFAAKAALYARLEFGMRSVSHVIAGEIAQSVKGEAWTKNFFQKIVRRPDDMFEILSYYFNTGAKAVPNSVKKGFALAINKMDEYKLSKYKGNNKSISMVDVVNLVHPKHTEAIGKLMSGELKPAETWETKVSATKGNKELKNKAWKDLVVEKKIAYFALLRNLRNIIEQAPEVIDKACEMLVDENLIRKSLVLPFRFLTAYVELSSVQGANKVLGAIGKAMDISFANVPKFDGKTLVVVDHSGSMGIGYDSPFMKGALFGVAMAKSNDADFMHFGDHAQYLSFNTGDSVLTIANWLDSLNKGNGYSRTSISDVGHGTNFHAIFEKASKKYDRIVIFSDMQGWMGYDTPVKEFNDYKKEYEANPFIYSVDLSGYGTLQFPENQVACLAGFSEKMFDIMQFCEQDKNVLIQRIESIEL